MNSDDINLGECITLLFHSLFHGVNSSKELGEGPHVAVCEDLQVPSPDSIAENHQRGSAQIAASAAEDPRQGQSPSALEADEEPGSLHRVSRRCEALRVGGQERQGCE